MQSEAIANASSQSANIGRAFKSRPCSLQTAILTMISAVLKIPIEDPSKSATHDWSVAVPKCMQSDKDPVAVGIIRLPAR